MANVLDFSTQFDWDWQLIEPDFRKMLERSEAGKEMTDHLCSVMKDYFKKYNIEFTLSVRLPAEASNQTVLEPIQQAANELGKQIKEMVYQILFHDILRLHIEIYHLRGPNPAG